MSINRWKVCEVECVAGFRIIPEEGGRSVAITIQRDPNAHGLEGITTGEALRHAYLVAASPELLALLVESQCSIGGDWRERRDAAIAKATGEA